MSSRAKHAARSHYSYKNSKPYSMFAAKAYRKQIQNKARRTGQGIFAKFNIFKRNTTNKGEK